MRRLRRIEDTDLRLVAAFVPAALVFGALPVPQALKTVVVVPALLLAPGYAVGIALFRRRGVPGSYRIALAFPLSVAAITLTALIVQIVLPLSELVLALAVTAVTVGAALLATGGRGAGESRSPSSRVVTPPGPVAAIGLVVAASLAAVAIAIASEGMHDQFDREPLTSAWLVPRLDGEPGSVEVGVLNEEGRRVDYRLEVRQGPRVLARRNLELDAGERWEATFAPPVAPAVEPLVGDLYLEGTLARTVTLRASGETPAK